MGLSANPQFSAPAIPPAARPDGVDSTTRVPRKRPGRPRWQRPERPGAPLVPANRLCPVEYRRGLIFPTRPVHGRQVAPHLKLLEGNRVSENRIAVRGSACPGLSGRSPIRHRGGGYGGVIARPFRATPVGAGGSISTASFVVTVLPLMKGVTGGTA